MIGSMLRLWLTRIVEDISIKEEIKTGMAKLRYHAVSCASVSNLSSDSVSDSSCAQLLYNVL
jgi:hypothetical protein